jgi:hypothetical protein
VSIFSGRHFGFNPPKNAGAQGAFKNAVDGSSLFRPVSKFLAFPLKIL